MLISTKSHPLQSERASSSTTVFIALSEVFQDRRRKKFPRSSLSACRCCPKVVVEPHHRGIGHANSGNPKEPRPLVTTATDRSPSPSWRCRRGGRSSCQYRRRPSPATHRRRRGGTREIFLRLIFFSAFASSAAAWYDGVGGDLAVLVVGDSSARSGLSSAGRRDPHGAARGRLQIAGADGDGGKAMQGIAELVERQRLDMKLDVGAVTARVGAGEDARLRRRHGQRPAAAEGVIRPIRPRRSGDQ